MQYQPMPREVAEQRLTEYIAQGREKSATVVKTLEREVKSRVSLAVPRQMMHFDVFPNGLALEVRRPDGALHELLPNTLGFTDWSRGQMLGTLGVNARFLQTLQEDGPTGAKIATGLLNDLRYRIGGEAESNGKARRLLRVVGSEVRGWLSPAYGIFDADELLGGVAQAVRESGQELVFTDGTITDRRYALSAIYPHILEAWEGEYLLFGGQIQSSDYGFGALDFIQNVIRLVCRNGMLGISLFRRIHRSAGLGGNDHDLFEISDRTRALSAQATVSMLTDAIRTGFSPAKMESALVKYRQAATKDITPATEAQKLRERGVISKDDESTIPKMIEMDLEVLPQTPSKTSALRFGQLLAYMAGQTDDGERSLNLMAEAGKYAIV